MLDLIQKRLWRLRQRYEKSGVAQFLSWWRNELLAALPPAWREWLAAERAMVTVAPVADGWRVRRVRVERIEAEETVAADRESLLQSSERLRPDQEQPPRQVLLLPVERTLRRRLTLPLAAEEHLASVLAFEMDRQTPFRADQVYFDHRIHKRDQTARTMLVELLAVPRSELDQVLQGVGNLDLDAADVANGEVPAGFNLLPSERRARRADQRLRLNAILAVWAVALLWLVMWKSLALREQAIERLDEEMAVTSASAMQSAELKRQLRDAIEGASFLANKKSEQAVVVDVLAEVTRLVPDDTWLERLSFVGNQVQLQGQSARADKLIGIFTDSRCLDKPQFQGIITPDGATGKERFSLVADLKTGACHGTDTAAGSGRGKPVAIGLALLALGLGYLVLFHGFITQHLAYATEISELKEAELRFRQVAAQRPQVEQRLAEVRQFQAGANYFLPEDSFDLAAANLNSQLKQIIADKARDPQRCQLISSQNERPTAPEPYQRVVVKVRMRCDLDDLTEILYELENATPFLFVVELNLYQQQMFQGGMPQPNLGDMDARFDVYGYIRQPGGAG